MTSYLDTSAAMKLVVEEAESVALLEHVLAAPDGGRSLVASWLLHTELHCAARRHPAEIGLVAVGTLLDAVTLVDLTRGDLLTAGGLPGRLRSADAVHLTVALRIGVDEMITYDHELAAAAVLVGLPVGRPA